MQIIKNIEQGSIEWLNLRLSKATASNFDKIITSTGKPSASASDYVEELAGEYFMEKAEEGYKNETMIRGNELEEEARQLYQERNLVNVEEVTIMTCEDWAYSPDGLVGNEGLIEIKCPLSKTHTKYILENKLPTKYKAQVQGGLYISGRKWCDFVSYNPSFKDDFKLFTVRVYRDEDFIQSLERELIKITEKKKELINQLIKNAKLAVDPEYKGE